MLIKVADYGKRQVTPKKNTVLNWLSIVWFGTQRTSSILRQILNWLLIDPLVFFLAPEKRKIRGQTFALAKR